MIEKICVPECYKDFHCIDVECTDSCCAGWQVDVDEQAYEEYKNVPGEFGEYIRSVMIEEGDCGGEKAQFRLRQDGRCPFLMDNGLCDMYAHLGEDSLCHTCTNFPRYMEDYGTMREMGIGFSCPEASRLMLSTEQKMEYVEMTLEPNENLNAETISVAQAQTISGMPREKKEWEAIAKDVMNRTRRKDMVNAKNSNEPQEIFQKAYYQILNTCRNTAFDIVTNRELSVKERALLYFDYGVCLQDVLDHARVSDGVADVNLSKDFRDSMLAFAQQYKETAFLKERCQILQKQVKDMPADHEVFTLYGDPVAKEEMAYALLPEYAAVIYQELHHCKPQWAILLDEAEQVLHKQMTPAEYAKCYQEFDIYYSKQMYEYEHLLNYFVFRYFLKSYFDDDVYGKVKIGVMGYLMVKELAVCQWVKQGRVFTKQDQIELFHLYARELEHSDENYEMFYEALQTEDFCNWEHMKALLCEQLG